MQNETEMVVGKNAVALCTFLVAETRRKSGSDRNKCVLVLEPFLALMVYKRRLLWAVRPRSSAVMIRHCNKQQKATNTVVFIFLCQMERLLHMSPGVAA